MKQTNLLPNTKYRSDSNRVSIDIYYFDSKQRRDRAFKNLRGRVPFSSYSKRKSYQLEVKNGMFTTPDFDVSKVIVYTTGVAQNFVPSLVTTSTLSFLIITRDSESHIVEVLQQAKQFRPDEIVVCINNKTKDKTEEIARQFTPKVYLLDFNKPYLESVLNEAYSKCTKDWIFRLDDDELISANFMSVRNKIFNTSTTAYFMPRYNCIKDVKHYISSSPWYPDWQLRLFKRSNLQIHDNVVHHVTSVSGKHERWNDCHIFHLNYLWRSRKEREQRWADYSAKKHVDLLKPMSLYEDYETKWKNNIKECSEQKISDIPVPFKMLIIVDVYDWAWDITSKELLANTAHINGKIVDVNDFKKGNIDPNKFNVVLVYPWYDKEIMEKLSPFNTVVCVAGGDTLEGDFVPLFKSNCADFIVFGAVNRKIQKHLKEKYPDKKIIILSHGTDTELFKPSVNTNKEFVIGWAGRNNRPLKRFELAKKIALEVEVPLKVVTPPREGNNLLHSQMPDFYNNISCLLVTSIVEAHPLVIYEAMASEIPVVTTDVGDVNEVITSKKSGFVLPVDASISEFVNAIRKLMSKKYGSSSIAYEIGRNARDIILKHWTWDKIVSQYENLNMLLEKSVWEYLEKNKKRIDWKSLKFLEGE